MKYDAARFKPRFVAFLIDFILPGLFVMMLEFQFDASIAGGFMKDVAWIFLNMALFGLFLVNQIYFTHRYGASLGKRLMGLQVLDYVKDTLPSLNQSWMRFYYFFFPMNYGPLIVSGQSYMDENNRTFHDRMSGTYVARRRS